MFIISSFIYPLFLTAQTEINIEKDIPFGESINFKGEKEMLKLDIYKPSQISQTSTPAIIWFHGGGFKYGNDKTQSYILEMSKRFAKRGYVCFSMNYRVRENTEDDINGAISDAVEDGLKGLNWVRQNSEKLGVDKTKIIIGGGSAGGILASNICYNATNKNENIDLSGVVALVNLWGSPDKKWGTVKVTKNAPPTIIVHGSEDSVVPFANSVKIVKQLNELGIKNELVTIKEAGHTPASHMNDFEVKIADFLKDVISGK